MSIVFDAHIDTTQRLLNGSWNLADRHKEGHVDLPRLREGGVTAAVLAVYAGGPLAPGEGVAAAKRQLAVLHDTARRHSDTIALTRTADEIRSAKRSGKIAMLIGIEGGYLIEDSLDNLREYHGAGAIYMTLTHAFSTNWADSSGVHEDAAPLHGGLTGFGREVIREMNRLGIIVDISHVSDAAFWQVIETTTVPVIASHSSCRAVCNHRRNLSDEMIRAIAETGGIVHINFAAAFVDPDFPEVTPEMIACWDPKDSAVHRVLAGHATPLERLVDHFDHAMQLVGPKHVGIGSDFDGTLAVPVDMHDCSQLPNLTAALVDRGYAESDLRRVLGENMLRVLDACLR